uniref:Uncharacterized protein n=1 Tax=Oryza glumipatula TaxID=40148 RepID=A0A0E0BPA2_9ORYZ
MAMEIVASVMESLLLGDPSMERLRLFMLGATHSQRHTLMSSRRGGESGGGDSPRRRVEAKSTTPRLQPGSAGGHSAAPSAEMSSRGWGESGGGDSLRLQGGSSSRKMAKSRPDNIAAARLSKRACCGVLRRRRGDRLGVQQGARTRSPVLGKAQTVVLCSSSKDALNRIAVAGGLDLDPKRSGVEIQKSKNPMLHYYSSTLSN